MRSPIPTATPSPSRHWPAFLIAPWLAFAGAEALAEQEDRRSKYGVVGVVGKWTEEVQAGQTVVAGDGSPGHTRPAGEIAQTATQLFGKADAAFVANATAPTAFSLGVMSGVTSFTEGRYRARFKLVSGESDQTAGLVFNFRPAGDYLFVRYNTREGNIALWRYADGKREVVARGETKVQLPLGQWHELSVTVTGRKVAGAVNKTLTLEHELTDAVSGRIGFWTKRDSVTEFTDISVEPRR